MEGRRNIGLVLILCFVIGMLVGQSTAKMNGAHTKCYDSCHKFCSYNTHGNYRGMIGCMKCAEYCRRKIEHEACFLIWCWKVKN